MWRPFPPLYAILDFNSSSRRAAQDCLSLASALAEAGVRLIQLRAKHAGARAMYEQAQILAQRLAPGGVRLIVNDRPDIAALAGAGGVHVGQEDLPAEEARKVCGAALWVGVSTHNLEQLRAAELTSADYIAVGPIFATSTKENPDPVTGLEFLQAARKETQKPLVAIGGITIESAEQAFRAGADSVAVIRDLAAAGDPGRRAREYLSIAQRVFTARNSSN